MARIPARPEDRRPWLYWMTPASCRNEAGITCAYLAADPAWHARAVTLLETACNEGVWAPAQNLTFLALAHANAGEVDGACATGLEAAGAVRRSGSGRHAVQLARIHTDLDARYPGDARVAELGEALR